jgi:hypothetical protein
MQPRWQWFVELAKQNSFREKTFDENQFDANRFINRSCVDLKFAARSRGQIA